MRMLNIYLESEPEILGILKKLPDLGLYQLLPLGFMVAMHISHSYLKRTLLGLLFIYKPNKGLLFIGLLFLIEFYY